VAVSMIIGVFVSDKLTYKQARFGSFAIGSVGACMLCASYIQVMIEMWALMPMTTWELWVVGFLIQLGGHVFGYIVSKIVVLDIKHRMTISLETGFQQFTLGMAIIHSCFGETILQDAIKFLLGRGMLVNNDDPNVDDPYVWASDLKVGGEPNVAKYGNWVYEAITLGCTVDIAADFGLVIENNLSHGQYVGLWFKFAYMDMLKFCMMGWFLQCFFGFWITVFFRKFMPQGVGFMPKMFAEEAEIEVEEEKKPVETA